MSDPKDLVARTAAAQATHGGRRLRRVAFREGISGPTGALSRVLPASSALAGAIREGFRFCEDLMA